MDINKDKTFLIVGWGSIGKRHYMNLTSLYPNSKFVVLRSQTKTERILGCAVVTDIDEALRYNLDVAFVCGPSIFHVEVAEKIISAGIHVFIEKPLSNTYEGLNDFQELSLKSNIKIMVGYNLRFLPSLLSFRELITTQYFGKPLFVSAEVGQYLPDWRKGVDYRTTVSARESLGGGALLELSHELDYLSWIFGEPVSASGQVQKISNLEIDVEDLVIANISFTNNVMCSLTLDFLQRRPSRYCKVVCEKGTIVWDAIEDRVTVIDTEQTSTYFQGDKQVYQTYIDEIIHFLDCIENDGDVAVSAEDGIKTIRLISKLQMSSNKNGVIVKI